MLPLPYARFSDPYPDDVQHMAGNLPTNKTTCVHTNISGLESSYD